MRKITASIVLSFIVALSTYGKGKYDNGVFSINSLVDENNISNTQPLIMMLPPSDGFAPNINIQVQAYPGSLDDYAALSMQQFRQLKFKVIKQMKVGNALIFEYSGSMQGRDFHWFAMAHQKGNNIFLITATSTENQWKTLSEKLIECVKSFKLQ